MFLRRAQAIPTTIRGYYRRRFSVTGLLRALRKSLEAWWLLGDVRNEKTPERFAECFDLRLLV
jgi:hypothetical protein